TDQDLILVDNSPHACVENANRSGNWEKVTCGEFTSGMRAQVKQDKGNFYCYYYYGQLKLEGSDTFDCENTVYKFSREIGFEINGHAWPQHHFTFRDDLNVLNQRM